MGRLIAMEDLLNLVGVGAVFAVMLLWDVEPWFKPNDGVVMDNKMANCLGRGV